MKKQIEERINRKTSDVMIYNTLFSIAVETAETSFSSTSTSNGDNEYYISSSEMSVNITCNDNDWQTVTVSISSTNNNGSATININRNGDLEENYSHLSGTFRSKVYYFVEELYSAIETYINSTKETTTDAS